MSGHDDKAASLAVAAVGTIASADRSGEIRLWDWKTGAFRNVLVQTADAFFVCKPFSPTELVKLVAHTFNASERAQA